MWVEFSQGAWGGAWDLAQGSTTELHPQHKDFFYYFFIFFNYFFIIIVHLAIHFSFPWGDIIADMSSENS